MAVPEDRVGGLRLAWWNRWMSGWGPESLTVLRISNLCHVGDKVDLAPFSWRFVFFSYVGVSRVCSSHSSHAVFSLASVGGRLVLTSVSSIVSSVCFGELGPVTRVGVIHGVLLYGFRLVCRQINLTFFFLIN
jgi:hypothetical protein